MDGRSGNDAIAGRAEGDLQAGRGGRDHLEVRITHRLVRQRTEADRLVRVADGKCLRHVRGRVVVAVARLRRYDRAAAGARQVHSASAHRAIAGCGEADRETGRGGGAYVEV